MPARKSEKWFLNESTGYIEGWYWENGQRIQTKRHRRIMELHIGRKLDTSEIVHHINGDKIDNRIDNLQVMAQSEHCTLHNLSREYQRGRKHNCSPELRAARSEQAKTLHKTGVFKTRKGEQNGTAKLTEDQVRAIRRRADAGEMRTLIQRDYPFVSVATIDYIAWRKSWKHVPEETNES